jgi:hypothetical protein
MVDGVSVVDIKDRLVDVEERLGAVHLLATTTSDDVAELKARLGTIKTLSELARTGRDEKAKKQSADPCFVLAKDTAVAAAKVDPAIIDERIVDKIVDEMKRGGIKGRRRRTYGRWVKRWREERTLPASAKTIL